MKYVSVLILALTLSACGQGSKGDSGTNGEQGVQGLVGPQGLPGQDGQPGSNGADGLNAPGVIAVSLCPGFEPSYPNLFPEYALCIDNKLYGVYSANGGFLAELPPGDYSSNGVNATCSLRIAVDCSVTRL